jgi:enoyl-CoA hydratase
MLQCHYRKQNRRCHIESPRQKKQLNADFWLELPEIIKDIDRGAKARVIVLSSTGPHFSAGLDLTSFDGVGQPPEGDEKKRKLQAAAAFYDNVLHMKS